MNFIKHIARLQSFHDAIIDCCLSSAQAVISVGKKRSRKKCIPGWSVYVEKYKKEALFWHTLWYDCGYPRPGTVANIRRTTRAKYHYAVKYVHKNKANIIANNMATSLLHNKSKDFWSDVKRIRGEKGTVPCTVDGFKSNRDVSNLFAQKYSELYNSVSYDIDKLQKLTVTVNNQIQSLCCADNCYSNHIFTVKDVATAMKKLKHYKSDGNIVHFSEYLINGSHKLHVFLSFLYNIMLIHGSSPDELLTATIVPIPKDKKKSLCQSSNYRGIALSSIVGKVLDLIVLDNNKEILQSSELQFGFKPKHSTSQCTMVLNEIIEYYHSNNTDTFVMMLDASKAFDRVNYYQLFNLLVNKRLCPMIIKLLLHLYLNQKICVKWGDL